MKEVSHIEGSYRVFKDGALLLVAVLLAGMDGFSDRWVLGVALASRVCFLLLCIVGDSLIVDHDAQGVTRSVEPVSWWFRAFTKWDAAHYLNIASKRGVRNEMELAFMPLFPRAVESVADLLPSSKMSRGDSLVCAGLLINMTCFAFSSLILTKLLKHWKVTGGLLTTAFLLHLFNPANVFFVTVYTESLYSLASWTGILLLERQQLLLASFPLYIASSTRANGVLNIVLPGFLLLKGLEVRPRKENSRGKIQLFFRQLPSFFATCIPYLILDQNIHAELCRINTTYYNKKPERCGAGFSLFFHGAYSFVQQRFWGVGFLEYYQVKQIPNFLLALPIIAAASFTLLSRHKLIVSSSSLLREALFIHLFFNVVVVTLYAHVQISTRLLCSATPILYLGLARLLQLLEHRKLSNSWWAIVFVLLSYNIFGCVAHVNFFPFT